MEVGKEIDSLITTHIKLWHSTSPARTDKSLSSEERVGLFMKTRKYNVERAITRDNINSFFKSGYQDPKMNYMNIEKEEEK